MNSWVKYYICLKYIKEQNTSTPDAFKNDNRNICLSQPKLHFISLPGNCEMGSLLRLKDRPEMRGDQGKGCSGGHLLAAHLTWGLVKDMAGARGNDLGQKPIIAPFSQAPPPCLPEPSKTAAWSVLQSLGKGPGVTDLLDSNPDLMWVQQ